MNASGLPSRTIIWATRGRAWGFRFLLRGDLPDPLLEYERVFAEIPEDATAWGRVADKVAVRFPDPENRRDAAGRTIPHQFVVTGALASSITSAEDGLHVLWPLVEKVYADIWQDERPPASDDVERRVDAGRVS